MARSYWSIKSGYEFFYSSFIFYFIYVVILLLDCVIQVYLLQLLMSINA